MKLTLILLIIMSYIYAAENVVCYGENEKWQVSFNLSEDYAYDIEFKFDGNVVAFYEKTYVSTSRFFKTISYEMSFGAFKYLDIERKLLSKGSLSVTGEGSFLLKNNPLGFARSLRTCHFTSEK